MTKGIPPGSYWRNELLKELVGKGPRWSTVADLMEPMHTMPDAEKEVLAKELVERIRAGAIKSQEDLNRGSLDV